MALMGQLFPGAVDAWFCAAAFDLSELADVAGVGDASPEVVIGRSFHFASRFEMKGVMCGSIEVSGDEVKTPSSPVNPDAKARSRCGTRTGAESGGLAFQRLGPAIIEGNDDLIWDTGSSNNLKWHVGAV